MNDRRRIEQEMTNHSDLIADHRTAETEPLAEADLDPEFGEDPQVGGGVHRSDVDPDRPFRADVDDLLTSPGETLDQLKAQAEAARA